MQMEVIERKMKIGVIVPNIKMMEKQLEERRSFLLQYAQEETKVVMVKLEEGPVSIESALEHEQAGYHIAKKVCELEAFGYHALITWCGEDAGLTAAREVAKIPVVGPFQSSCSIAITLGHRFSIVGPMVQKVFMERKVWELGLGSRLASVRSLGIPVIDTRKDLKKTSALLKKECEKIIKKDRADVIILSCMALFGLARSLMKELKTPVIDPALAALKTAEIYVSLGLGHSRTSYPFPHKSPFL
jgi:allantoin racemase